MEKIVKYEIKQLFVIDCISCSDECKDFHKGIVYTEIKAANTDLKQIKKDHIKVKTLEEMISEIAYSYY